MPGVEDLENGVYDAEHERGSDMWMEANQSSARIFEKSKISALRGRPKLILKVACVPVTHFVCFSAKKTHLTFMKLLRFFQTTNAILLLTKIKAEF